MPDFLKTIDTALTRKGLSATEASKRAVNSPNLIRDMRANHMPRLDRFIALCKILDIPFIVGEEATVTNPMINKGLMTEILEIVENHLTKNKLRLDSATKSKLISELYEMSLEDSNHDNVKHNAERFLRVVA